MEGSVPIKESSLLHNKGYWYPDNWSKFDESEVFRTCNLAMWSGWYSRVTIIVPKVVIVLVWNM